MIGRIPAMGDIHRFGGGNDATGAGEGHTGANLGPGSRIVGKMGCPLETGINLETQFRRQVRIDIGFETGLDLEPEGGGKTSGESEFHTGLQG